jgi:hypothetical protein
MQFRRFIALPFCNLAFSPFFISRPGIGFLFSKNKVSAVGLSCKELKERFLKKG